MTLTNTTQPPRKNLASQIDRLDSILDGLAENLNEAVSTAVQQAVTSAVQEAVKQAVIEVVTNAELQQLLHPTPPRAEPQGARQPGGLWRAVRGFVGKTGQAVAATAAATGGWLASAARQVGERAAACVEKVRRAFTVAGGWLATKASRLGNMVAAGLGKARRVVCGFVARVATSRVAEVLGACGLAVVAYHCGGAALAGAAAVLTLALPAAAAWLMGAFGRTLSTIT
jgi:hypothetical protein